jgi:hypothetical protein
MKALNTKERNSAILRFSLWMIICVVIVCIPVIFAILLPSFRNSNVNKGTQAELAELNREVLFLKDTMALQIRDIADIQKKFDADKSKIATYNLELLNIAKKLEADTTGRSEWMVEIYNNISAISKNLIEANEIRGKASEVKTGNKDNVNNVIIEFQSIATDVKNQLKFKSGNTLHGAFVRIDNDLTKAMRKLEALKQ